MNKIRKLITVFFTISVFFILTNPVFAMGKSAAINAFANFLTTYTNATADEAKSTAENEVGKVIDAMKASQAEIDDTLSELNKRVNAINSNDSKKNTALDKLDDAESAVKRLTDLDSDSHLDVISYGMGIPPSVQPDEEFQTKESDALDAMATVNRVLLAPSKPGNVPEGDLLEDFGPQLIRLLFRFASVIILIAFITSGIYMVISFDNEERITKAKNMIYYTLIGFAFVVFAFAIVKAITDIDFFNFI